MGAKFERVVAFGPVINCNNRETWTAEVERLYERVLEGDYRAVAGLLSADEEFIRDTKVFFALIALKYDPDQQRGRAKAELRRIATVLTRRPKPTGKLPHGDRLYWELQNVIQWLSSADLFSLRDEKRELGKRIRELLSPSRQVATPLPEGVESVGVEWESKDGRVSSVDPPEPSPPSPQELQQIDKTCKLIVSSARTKTGQCVRTERSWALKILAAKYKTKPGQVENRIKRDEIVQRLKKLNRQRKPA